MNVIWKTETLTIWVKWFRVWVSIYTKGVVNWFFIFGTSLGMGSGWVPISLLPVSYPCFEIGENSNSYLVKAGKTCQIGFGSGGYPQVWVLLPCLGVILGVMNFFLWFFFCVAGVWTPDLTYIMHCLYQLS